MTEDQEIIQAVLNGDRERYSELVERYADRAHAIAYSHLRDVQAAEDVAQEALVKAFSALQTLAKPEAFGAWLGSITRNLSRSAFRKKRVKTEDLEGHYEVADTRAKGPRQSAAENETGDLLEEALSKISPKISEAIVLFYLKELSITEVSKALGVPENTVKQRLHRGRKLLRERLEEVALGEGRRKLRVSQNFLSSVIIALPSQPWKIGVLGKLSCKLAFLPFLMPYLLPVVIILVTQTFTSRLILMDMDHSNEEWMHSHKKFTQWIFRRISLLIISMMGLFALTQAFPSLAWIWVIFPILMIPAFCSKDYLLSTTWKEKVGTICLCGTWALLAMQILYPHLSSEVGPWLSLLFIPVFVLGGGGVLLKKIGGSSKKEDSLRENAPEIKPVTMEFLKKNAYKFSRVVNNPMRLFTKIEVEEDHICFSCIMTKLMGFLTKGAPAQGFSLFSIKLYPEGTVEVETAASDDRPKHWGTVEEQNELLADYFKTSWAYYASGNKSVARSISIPLFPQNRFFVRKTGRRILQTFIWSSLALVIVINVGLFVFMGMTPRLNSAAIERFYKDEFMRRYKNDFKELASDTDRRMITYYKQPPSMMAIEEVRAAYLDLLNKKRYTSQGSILFSQIREVVNGLEAGYLTIPMLQEWDLAREDIENLGYGEWASLPSCVMEKDEALSCSHVEGMAHRVRLLNALGAIEFMDQELPDKLIERLDYKDGTFTADNATFKTTCQTACILTIFDRWDLADKEAVKQYLVNWLGNNRYSTDSGNMYNLALGLIAVDGTDEVPLAKLASRIRPKNNAIIFKNSVWGVPPHNIDSYAIKEILSEYPERLLLEPNQSKEVCCDK
ncbi:RNA polymerase sigma factor [Pontiella sulfatireligans]|uniref:RNA polymerase sigma factor n=1 Tax=Pontiella sulfatireligans TaxID=2750658 RepID=A0A6C2UHF1_9BACT|nr:RNA polymerase sigma factor [Pontiella sulfatireligans]VGO19642.1 ECF RNA polymerase sigma factor SigW [Pontiella sulfatireligans]